MVLVLGSGLDISLRDRNALLEAAGFTAAYRDEPLDAPEEASLRRAVELVVDRMEPHGAVVVDREWNVMRMNRGAARMLGRFIQPTDEARELFGNVVVATLHPLALRPHIVNFEEVAAITLDRARREWARSPGDAALARLRERIARIPDLPSPSRVAELASPGPFITVHLRDGDTDVRLFTTIATIGTPIDATAEELRIETYFPADDATAAWVRRLAESELEA